MSEKKEIGIAAAIGLGLILFALSKRKEEKPPEVTPAPSPPVKPPTVTQTFREKHIEQTQPPPKPVTAPPPPKPETPPPALPKITIITPPSKPAARPEIRPQPVNKIVVQPTLSPKVTIAPTPAVPEPITPIPLQILGYEDGKPIVKGIQQPNGASLGFGVVVTTCPYCKYSQKVPLPPPVPHPTFKPNRIDMPCEKCGKRFIVQY